MVINGQVQCEKSESASKRDGSYYGRSGGDGMQQGTSGGVYDDRYVHNAEHVSLSGGQHTRPHTYTGHEARNVKEASVLDTTPTVSLRQRTLQALVLVTARGSCRFFAWL
jgi:hypothetical protein